MKTIWSWWRSDEIDRFLFKGANRFRKGFSIRSEGVIPDVGCVLCIHHFENPLSFSIAVNLYLHRHPMTGKTLA